MSRLSRFILYQYDVLSVSHLTHNWPTGLHRHLHLAASAWLTQITIVKARRRGLKACGPERKYYVIGISNLHHLRSDNRDVFPAGPQPLRASFTALWG